MYGASPQHDHELHSNERICCLKDTVATGLNCAISHKVQADPSRKTDQFYLCISPALHYHMANSLTREPEQLKR